MSGTAMKEITLRTTTGEEVTNGTRIGRGTTTTAETRIKEGTIFDRVSVGSRTGNTVGDRTQIRRPHSHNNIGRMRPTGWLPPSNWVMQGRIGWFPEIIVTIDG